MESIQDSRAYKYAQFAANDDTGKTPRYVRRQCKDWLSLINSGSRDALFDESEYSKIEKLLRLMMHPDLGCSMLDGLEDYALLFIAALFCTKTPDGRRYYTTGLLEIARKNFKTFTSAVIFIIALLVCPKFSRLFSVAPDLKLSSELKVAIRKIIKSSPALEKHFKVMRSEVRCGLTDTEYTPLAYSKDKLDGKLAHVFLADEVGAMDGYPVEAMRSSQVVLKDKLGILISTQYPTDDNGLIDEIDFAKKQLDGLYDGRQHYFSLLYEPDDEMDGDGLSNKEEIELSTSVSSADTDEDGLSDYDEINKHNTDPLKADSDADTLNDGEEIAIGLDPNDPETFGVPDAEYKVEQTISADSEAMSEINTEESPYELSLDISATGNAATRLSANESTYSAVTESNARLGGAVELRYLGGDVDKVKLTYKIADEYISNENSEYSENCLDLQGIKRYNIFRYFEEINMLLPVATEFDEESNTLYAETDELGTYCVLDMEVLMRNFGIEPEETSTETVERLAYSVSLFSEEDNTDASDDKYNIVFIIDNRSSVISFDQYAAIKEQILKFAETIVTEKRDFTISIYKQSASDFIESCCTYRGDFEPQDYIYSSTGDLSDLIGYLTSFSSSDDNLFGETCIISDGLNEAINSCDSNTQNYIFDIYSQDNSVYDAKSVNGILDAALAKNVNLSIISNSGSLTGFQSELAGKTSGLVLDYGESFAEKIYEHIFNEEYVPKEIPTNDYGSEFDAILATGLQKVVLNSKLYANGVNPTGEDTDTDMDGLSDWDEINFAHWEGLGLITYDEKHNVILPTIGQCVDFTNKSYVLEGLKRLAEDSDYAIKLLNTRVMPISSDPTHSDGDGDGLLDSYEKNHSTNPLNADCDGDGLSDGEEYRYGTSPRNKDSDCDGLDDKFEIDNGLDPLDWDTDGDGIYDDEDQNPNKFDVDWEGIAIDLFVFETGFYIDYLDGVVRGDFIRDPNLAQLIGMIAGSFIPGIDIRDVIANLINGDLGNTALSAVGLVPAAGDITKLVKKVSDFIITGAKNADEIGFLLKLSKEIAPQLIDGLKQADNFSDVLKHVPCNEAKELFISEPAIMKLLELPSNSGKYADEVVEAYRRIANRDALGLVEEFAKTADFKSVADFEKQYMKIIDNVSGFSDKLRSVVENTDSRTALKIADVASEYGEIVVDAVNKCGCESIYKITHYIAESGVSNASARKLFGALANYGDTMLKAIEKAGSKNIENIIDIISKVNPNQVDNVLNLIANHGDDMVRAIKNCGTDKIDLILELANTPVKITWGDVLAIERMPDKIVWLEIGKDKEAALAETIKRGVEVKPAGYKHILEEHRSQFIQRGIAEDDLIDVIMQALRENNVVGKQSEDRLVYLTKYKGRDYVIAITVGSNGFVVGANLKSLEEFIK